MFPLDAVTFVATFPPAALPAFIGTTPPSDSRCRFRPPCFVIACWALPASLQDPTGSPSLPSIPHVRHAMLFDPGEAREHLPRALPGVDFRVVNRVVLLTYMVRPALQEKFRFCYLWWLVSSRPLRRPSLRLINQWWWGLWSCGREARKCGQAGDNPPNGLSPACPHVPQGAGRSAGLVHKSTGQI